MSKKQTYANELFYVPGTVLSIGTSLPRNGHNPNVTANRQYIHSLRNVACLLAIPLVGIFHFAAQTRETSVNNTNSLKLQTSVF